MGASGSFWPLLWEANDPPTVTTGFLQCCAGGLGVFADFFGGGGQGTFLLARGGFGGFIGLKRWLAVPLTYDLTFRRIARKPASTDEQQVTAGFLSHRVRTGLDLCIKSSCASWQALKLSASVFFERTNLPGSASSAAGWAWSPGFGLRLQQLWEPFFAFVSLDATIPSEVVGERIGFAEGAPFYTNGTFLVGAGLARSR